MINNGRSPNLRHVTRTRRVDPEWQFERVSLDHSIFDNVQTNDQLTDFFDIRNVHHNAVAFIVDSVANQTTL